MNPQKILLNGGDEFEWVPAEVISVDYQTVNPSRLYTILCKFLNAGVAGSPTDVIQARPLHANIKNIPIEGEVVFVCKAPSPYHSGGGYGREFYYTHPISIQSSVHHNGLPGANLILLDKKSQKDKAQDARTGITRKLTDRTDTKQTIDGSFPERLDVFPIQPFSGDVIIEGRWGQSIRLGSSVNQVRPYQQGPNWRVGAGATGNPITIISNGTNPKKSEKSFNQFHIESPDEDDSSIWLTSGQSVSFKPASDYAESIYDKQIAMFKSNWYSGNQIILSSDRIVLNSKKQEIVGFAKEGIGFSTEKTLALNAKNIVEIAAGRILLGFNATHPMVLGDRLINLLNEFMNLVVQMNEKINMIQHPTGVGPSGTPINSGDFVFIKNQINSLIDTLPDLASKFAFVNEFTGNPPASERDKYRDLAKNNFVVEPTTSDSGNQGTREKTVKPDTNYRM
jgi:hypothetical protein